MSFTIPKRSVIVAGHRTSVSLEDEFFETLKSIASARNLSINDLVTEVDQASQESGQPRNLSSSLRLFVLDAVMKSAMPGGGVN